MAKKKVAAKTETETTTETGGLVAMLKAAGADDLPLLDEGIAELDRQIGRLKNERSSLASAKKLIGIRLHGSTIGRRGAKQKEERRAAVYDLLDSMGPLGAGAIAQQTSIPKGSLNGVLNHEWFERTSEGWGIAMTRSQNDE